MLGQRWDVTTLTRYCPGCHDRTLFCWKEEHRNGVLTLLLVVTLWATVGCANMTPQHRRASSGGAIGAADGTAGGAIIGWSPDIGAAGALWDDINRALKWKEGIDAAPRFTLFRGCIRGAVIPPIIPHHSTLGCSAAKMPRDLIAASRGDYRGQNMMETCALIIWRR
jgi:hypothetical protein